MEQLILDIITQRAATGIPLVVWGLLSAVALTVVALLYYDLTYKHLERKASRQINKENNRLALVLQAEGSIVWTYDVPTRKYQRLSIDGKLDKEYTPFDFSRFFDRDDFEELRNEIFAVRDGNKESVTLRLRSAQGETEMRRYEVKVKVLKRDETGVPTTIVGVQRDVTHERQQRERERDELLTYQNIFNSSIIDMVLYDEMGIINDINDHACQTFGITDKQAFINARQRLENVTYFNYDAQKVEKTHCVTSIDIQRMEKEGRKAKGVTRGGNLLYEMMLFPLRDEQGELLGMILQGRDTTDMVTRYRTERHSMKELQAATNDVKAYVENINMALQMADIRLMSYLPERHVIQITTDLNQPRYELTQIRALDCIAPEYRLKARRLIKQMDHGYLNKVEQRLKTIFRDKEGRNIWMTFLGIAMRDEEGHVTHYFGMGRNDTRLVHTENRLRQETQKAQEAEELKDSFLQNMSYEIRTPLANVLGFAELFEQEHNPQDEPVFVEEIKKSSNALLELVNDILYISRIDAHMIEVKPQQTDFALTFDGHCHMGWSHNTSQNLKTIIENPYEHLEVIIDDELLGKVIEMLVFWAVHFTREGSVRAKYEYRQGALNITVEDSGVGIDRETLPHIFDRFCRNQDQEQCGSGLVLPIVKGLVELMGGSVEFSSELGKGTSAWVSIPCERVSSEMKKDIIS